MLTDIITERLRDAGARFNANDNISQYIYDGELRVIEDELTDKFTGVLRSLLIDIENDPNSMETPRRLAKMYLHETFRGRYYPAPKVTAFPSDRAAEARAMETRLDGTTPVDHNTRFQYTGLLVIRADIKSTCSHHHAPVTGTAYIGIIPRGKVLGLSKYIRIAQHVARRGCLQEELTQDILKAIVNASGTQNVAVYIEARHGCVENRGVAAHNSLTQTVELGGLFYTESELRKEFYDNIKLQQGADVR